MRELTEVQISRLEKAAACTEWQVEKAKALAWEMLRSQDPQVVATLAQTLATNYLAEIMRPK